MNRRKKSQLLHARHEINFKAFTLRTLIRTPVPPAAPCLLAPLVPLGVKKIFGRFLASIYVQPIPFGPKNQAESPVLVEQMHDPLCGCTVQCIHFLDIAWENVLQQQVSFLTTLFKTSWKSPMRQLNLLIFLIQQNLSFSIINTNFFETDQSQIIEIVQSLLCHQKKYLAQFFHS